MHVPHRSPAAQPRPENSFMSLISIQNLEFSVGGPAPLLHGVDLEIEPNERVCIVGRNGAGKSTLLKLLAREIVPEDGVVRVDGGTVVTRLAQEVPPGTAGTVFDVVAEALARGLLTLGCGTKTIRLLPPLDSTEREIELGVAIFIEAAKAVDSTAVTA